jgi:membrane-bound metal-dependent hydrolase YbcI (DUF457 family)
MPSPIGHALAGIAVAWSADLVPGDRAWRATRGPSVADTGGQRSWFQRAGGRLTLLCAGLGAAPDLDLLYPGHHRSFTHGIAAVLCVGLIAAVFAANTRRPVARVAIMCTAAYASHLLLDWLGVDQYPPYGLQLLWPFSRRWFISGLDVFRQTELRRFWMPGPIATNVRAISRELAILGSIAAALWLIRIKALAGLAPQARRPF